MDKKSTRLKNLTEFGQVNLEFHCGGENIKQLIFEDTFGTPDLNTIVHFP